MFSLGKYRPSPPHKTPRMGKRILNMSETVQRGKIKKAPAAEVVKYLIRPAIEGDLKRSYNTILDINKAHILMLAKPASSKRTWLRNFSSLPAGLKAKKTIRHSKSIPMSKTCTLTWSDTSLS